MNDLKYIKTFIFGFAQYHLSDGDGDDVILKINYKDNSFAIEEIGNFVNLDFRKEIKELANSLLLRKHGINRAREIQK